ncbi:MAG: GC-type dockerin domain-anchored protein [Planctomycetota bacterium]
MQRFATRVSAGLITCAAAAEVSPAADPWAFFNGSGEQIESLSFVEADAGQWVGSTFTPIEFFDTTALWRDALPEGWLEGTPETVTLTAQVTFRRLTNDCDFGVGLSDGVTHVTVGGRENDNGQIVLYSGAFADDFNRAQRGTPLPTLAIGSGAGYPERLETATLHATFEFGPAGVLISGRIDNGPTFTAPSPVPLDAAQGWDLFLFGEQDRESYEFLNLTYSVDPAPTSVHTEFWDAGESIADAQPAYAKADGSPVYALSGELAPGDVADMYILLWPRPLHFNRDRNARILIETESDEQIGYLLVNAFGDIDGGSTELVGPGVLEAAPEAFTFGSNNTILIVYRSAATALDETGQPIDPADDGVGSRIDRFEPTSAHESTAAYTIRFPDLRPRFIDGPWAGRNPAPGFEQVSFVGTTGCFVSVSPSFASGWDLDQTGGNSTGDVSSWSPSSNSFVNLNSSAINPAEGLLTDVGGDTSGGLVLMYDDLTFARVDNRATFNAFASQSTNGGGLSVEVRQRGPDGFASGSGNFSDIGSFSFTLEMRSTASVSLQMGAEQPFEFADQSFGTGFSPSFNQGDYPRDAAFDDDLNESYTPVFIGERVGFSGSLNTLDGSGDDFDGAWRPLRVIDPTCPLDTDRNEVLDIFDIIAFLGLFDALDPAADVAEPAGVFDVFDVIEFLALFEDGCD